MSLKDENKNYRIYAEKERDNAFLLASILLMLIAFLLRIYRIGELELWLDEAYSYRQTVVVDWLGSLLRDNSPPLYNLMLRAWTGLAGTSEAVLRMPSAISGTLFVFVACFAGKEFFGRCAGIWSGIIATFSPIHVYYSQEARNYSLLTLLLMLVSLFLVRAARDGRQRDWSIAVIFALLSLYTHYLASLALIPMVAIVLVWSHPIDLHRNLKKFGFCAALAMFLLIPWMLWSFVLTDHLDSGFNWMTMFWNSLPPVRAIPGSFEAFSFLTGPDVLQNKTELGQMTYRLPPRLFAPARIFMSALFLWAVLPYGEGKLSGSDFGRKKIVVLALIFVPLIILWGISLARPIYIVSRYDMIAYPAFILLIGLAFAKAQQFKGRLLIIVVACCWLSASGYILYKLKGYPTDSLEKSTAQQLIYRVQSGDVVVFTGLRSYVTRYYLEQLGLTCRNWRCSWPNGTSFRYRRYPTANEDEEAIYNDSEIRDNPQQIVKEIEEFLAMRKDVGSTLWLALSGRLSQDQTIDLRYYADKQLFNELQRLHIACQLVAPKSLILACRER